MPIRDGIPLTFKAQGLTDAIDATNAFPGALSVCQDLVPNISTANTFVPRPASTQVTNFAGFTTPAGVTALLVIGTRAYGMISSARFAGKDEPFCYDLVGGSFVTIGNVTSANCPTTQSTSGDWIPPQMEMIGNKIMITHPGYSGVTNFVGWIDVRAFTSNTITGSTHTSTTIDTLSSNVLQAGWQVGDAIAGAGVPAGTYITAINAAGTAVTLSQAATATAAGVTLTVTSGTPAAPVYGAGQVSGQALLSAPIAVAQFNGRAWYAVGNIVVYTDALNPMQVTNASQSLTIGDNTAVTAFGGLPLSSQVVGGVIQSLIVFKGGEILYQITGDSATSNLAVNAVNGSVGTLAPNTIVGTPLGLAFIAPDGLRIIGLDGKASEPIGAYGSGVNVPFVNAQNPSRMCAAYNQNVLRVSVKNGAAQGQPTQEYWFDFNLKIWTGPHGFPAALIQPYQGANPANAFIMAANGINAKLWQSNTFPNASSTYTENGAAMSWVWQTSLMPDNDQTSANQIVRAAMGFSLPAAQTLTILAADEQGNQLDSVSLTGSGGAGAVWGSFNWGAGVWGTSVSPYQEYGIPWHNTLVFKQMFLRVTGASNAGFVIGNLYATRQLTGYLGAH